MGYDSKHVDIKEAKDGYNRVADDYGKYHTLLDKFDQGMFKRFLPRSGKTLNIIDLWAGDGRLFKHLSKLPHKRYVACDIADKLLKKHPGKDKVEKIVCDLREALPFRDNTFDLATSFFVFEHLQQIDTIFNEVERILAPGGRWIIGHFLQRHEFLRRTKEENFKIEFYNHRLSEIEELAKDHFWEVDVFPVMESDDAIGYIILLEKK